MCKDTTFTRLTQKKKGRGDAWWVVYEERCSLQFSAYLSKRFTVSKIWLSEDNLTWRVFRFSCTTATRVRNYFCYESDCDVRIKLNIFHSLGRNVTFLFAWKMAVYTFDSKAQIFQVISKQVRLHIEFQRSELFVWSQASGVGSASAQAWRIIKMIVFSVLFWVSYFK